MSNIDGSLWLFIAAVFTYASNHRVDEVNKAGYDGCSSSNVIKSHADGNTTITLNSTGPYYFLCPIQNHCSEGMKLTVTVTSSGSSPTPGGTPSTNTSSPPPPARAGNGAMGRFHWMDALVAGACLMLLPLLGLMG